MHRFLARDPDTNRLHNCRMKRLTFGIASSPWPQECSTRWQMTTRTSILKLQPWSSNRFTLTIASREPTPLQKLQDLCSLVAEGQMVLGMWRSNCNEPRLVERRHFFTIEVTTASGNRKHSLPLKIIFSARFQWLLI